jgi:hypothetical protein
MVEGAIGRDAKEPCAERQALERSDGPPRREESVLHDILGIRCRADDPQRVAIKRSLLPPREILECARVTAPRSFDEEFKLTF